MWTKATPVDDESCFARVEQILKNRAGHVMIRFMLV